MSSEFKKIDIIDKILDVYFSQGGNITACHQLVKHQIDSYNDFLDRKLDKIVSGYNPIKIFNDYNTQINDYNQKIFIYIEEPHFTKPIYKKQDGTQITMTPNMARLDNLTYSTDLYVNARVVTQIYDKECNTIETRNKKLLDIYIGKLPVMVGSKACILTIVPEENINSECRYDMGGYFIVNGNEKVLINQDRIKENYVLVFKPANNTDNIHAEIRSMNDAQYLPAKTISLTMSTKSNHMGRVIRVNSSFLKSEIPVFVMFRALGVLSDYDIIHHIVFDVENDINQVLINELRACCEDATGVYTKEDAMDCILRNITGNNKNTKTTYVVENTLKNEFLPHVSDMSRKALYLGHMIRKILKIYLGLEKYDNRDSYINKRIDTPGILVSSLFRQCYGRITKELKANIERDISLWRANNNSVVDLVSDKQHITKYFKQSLLDSWLKTALSTGNWGIKVIGSFQNIKQGVSQVLNRMSYHSTLSHLRRINTAMEKNGKLVQPRKLDNSQFGMICPAECFDPNTPILMWNGTIKKAQDIAIGDYLIDDKGNAVRVKSTCSGNKVMYDVIPQKKNFMKHTVTDNHILTLKVKQHKYVRKNKDKVQLMWFDKKELKFMYKTFDKIEECDKFSSTIDDDDVVDMTIEKYLSLAKSTKKLLYIFKSEGINWEKKEVALDPYILGMWLGDGLSRGYGFITADKELLDVWIKWGEDNDATITKNKHKYRYTLGSTINKTQSGINCNKTEKAPLKKLLDKYNLVNNKHIPLDYLTNDRKTRLAVLAGLIDTDGNVRANGHEIRISQGEPNYNIITDTEFLARSLGFSCHVHNGTCTYYVKGEKRQKPYKELTITGKYLYEIPTVLPRKKLNKCNSPTHEKKCSAYLLSLFELVKKDVQPFVGWQLDGNGRFLSGDMTTYHNTPEGAPVGLVKNMAMSTNISIYSSTSFIKTLLIENGVIEYNTNVEDRVAFLKKMGYAYNAVVMVNGDLFGYHTEPDKLFETFQSFKRQSIFHPVTSVAWDVANRFILISTEGGRMYRPLFIVDNNTELRLEKFIQKYGIDDIATWPFEAFISPYLAGKEEKEGFVEYLDIDEIAHAMIAMYPKDLKKSQKGVTLNPRYTHCEIHPCLMNGVLASNVAFSNHNQAPRNTYQCIWEDEEIRMADGTTKKIKEVEIGDKVLSFNTTTHVSLKTQVVNYMIQDTDKNIVKLTTGSGRNIVCTDDHKFMTLDGWKPPCEFTDDTKLGVICDNIYRKVFDEKIESKIVLDVPTMIKNLEDANVKDSLIKKHMKYLEYIGVAPLISDNTNLEIMASLFGYILTDGSVNVYNKKHGGMTPQVQVCLGRQYDAEKFNEDIATLGFTPTRINDAIRTQTCDNGRKIKHHTFDVCYNGVFASFIIAIGMTPGKKTETVRKPIPDWIVNGSKEIKRYFLSGFQGGDGCKIAIYDNRLYFPTTYQQTTPNLKQSLLRQMEQISKMFNDLDINSKVAPVYDLNINRVKIGCHISNNIDNTIKYYRVIGYRYSTTKNVSSGIVIEYLKEKRIKYDIIDDYSTWVSNVNSNGETMFLPVKQQKHKKVRVVDIEVEDSNHAFVAKSSIMASNCAMGKQALGVYMTNFNNRMDTISNVLNYPQKSLIRTKLSKYTHAAELPAGINAMVAIMTYSGFNQEDGIMVNRGALERGLFVSTHYKTIKEQCSKNHSTGEEEVFCNPDPSDRSKPYNYNKLNAQGFVDRNTYVEGGDVIIGKIMPRKIKGKIHNIDASVCMKPNEKGIIDLNYNEINNEGYAFCKVRIRNHRKPVVGDKLASSIAQKASIGMIYNPEDMPYTKDGVVPDLIMNPHAIPSRMTIAQLMECVLGKVACIEGKEQDSTPYNQVSVKDICDKLESYGMERHSNEILYDGYTGQQIKTEIFIGPTYYQRLKHMVSDKVHSRGSNGPIVLLTRQPSEGRSRCGGLRMGEMERDAIVAHGASLFLKERLLECSDNSRQCICKTCGMIIVSNPDSNIYNCAQCRNNTNPTQIRIPYSFKLLMQELQCMNIGVRMII